MLHLCVPLFPFQHHLLCLIKAKALLCKDLPFTGICEMLFTVHLWIHSGHSAAKLTLITTINNLCFNLSSMTAVLLTGNSNPKKQKTNQNSTWKRTLCSVWGIALSIKYEKNPYIQICMLNYQDLLQIAVECSNLWVCRIFQSTLLLKASFFIQSFTCSFVALFFMDFSKC